LQSLSLLPFTILITSIYLVLLLIPLSLAIAVLRYRLWDVDVLINKTLVYSMLTGILAAVYVGCIIGLQALFREIVKQNSDVAIYRRLYPSHRCPLPAPAQAHPGSD